MKKWWFAVFSIIEFALYGCILTCGGKLLVATSYAAIVLCAAFALTAGERQNLFLKLGLFCTVGADFCLVVCNPIERLWGMIFFLMAQGMYAIWLSKGGKPLFWWIRLSASVAAVALTVAVLGEKTDALALISVCYYANLLLNLLQAACRKDGMLTAAFVLFILCDTVIGFQVASGGYLPIAEGKMLHRLLFSGFNLAWFFYLPSQVLLALGTAKKE